MGYMTEGLVEVGELDRLLVRGRVGLHRHSGARVSNTWEGQKMNLRVLIRLSSRRCAYQAARQTSDD